MDVGDTAQRIVTLTTDFGTQDAYVGAMKGVLLGRAPGCTVVDLTHDVPPQDVLHAALVVASATPYFPDGTIHVVVVDPGVGTERRALAVRTGRAFFVGPDNGVLSAALADDPVEEAVHLTEVEYWLAEVSSTFHGRDIFAPVAAALVRGTTLRALGRPAEELRQLAIPVARRDGDGTVQGEVVSIDRFGNCITNIGARLLVPSRAYDVRVSEHRLSGVRSFYGSVAVGSPVVVLGSLGHVEVAVRNGDASSVLGVGVGAPVTMTVRGPAASGG